MMPSHAPTPPAYEVVICTYNGADFIGEQLSSILGQQPPPAGVIVSDDGSADNTLALVEEQARSSSIPIKIIQGPAEGIVANMLHALRSEEHTSELQSRGHLVCRLLLEK